MQRAEADGGRAGIGVAAGEDQRAAAVLGQRARACADDAVDQYVSGPADGEAVAAGIDNSAAQGEGVDVAGVHVVVGIDSGVVAQGDYPAEGIVAGNVPQGAGAIV